MISNLEIIKKFYELFKNQDKGYQQLCDEDIEWNVLDGMPNGGIYVGRAEVFENYFPKMLSNYLEFQAIPVEFLDAGEKIIVLGCYKGMSKLGIKFDVPFCHVYTVRQEKIIRFQQFTDTRKLAQS